MGLLRRLFISLAGADGKVQREEFRERVKSGAAELRDVLAMKSISEVFDSLDVERFTFVEFATAVARSLLAASVAVFLTQGGGRGWGHGRQRVRLGGRIGGGSWTKAWRNSEK